MKTRALVAIITFTLQLAAAHAEFIVLPDNAALGVSPDGMTVVGQRDNPNGLATKWTEAGGQTDLPEPGYLSVALAASEGSFIAGFRYQNPDIYPQAVRWNATNSINLGRGVAFDISEDGAVVVGRKDSGDLINDQDSEPFRWTQSTGMVGLGYLPGASLPLGSARGVSADGTVIVGGSSSSATFSFRTEAFRWTEAGGMVGLGDLPGGQFDSIAVDANSDGAVIIGNGTVQDGADDLASAGFRWTQSTGMTSLGPNSRATGISDDGSIIVGRGVIGSASEAVLWSPNGGMHSIKAILAVQGIDMTGWVLSEAEGVSADGRVIVGRARRGSDPFVNYVAIIPEPAALSMIAPIAMLSCAVLRTRRRGYACSGLA
jgi:probable HAF family extracellular repeat protein